MGSGVKAGIREVMSPKSTEELLAIWRTNHRDGVSPQAFEVIAEILGERGVQLPPQQEYRPGPNTYDMTSAFIIPDGESWAGSRIRRFGRWASLLSLGVVLVPLLGFFSPMVYSHLYPIGLTCGPYYVEGLFCAAALFAALWGPFGVWKWFLWLALVPLVGVTMLTWVVVPLLYRPAMSELLAQAGPTAWAWNGGIAVLWAVSSYAVYQRMQSGTRSSSRRPS